MSAIEFAACAMIFCCTVLPMAIGLWLALFDGQVSR